VYRVVVPGTKPYDAHALSTSALDMDQLERNAQAPNFVECNIASRDRDWSRQAA
jgi:hypothetical protein